MPQQEEGEHEL